MKKLFLSLIALVHFGAQAQWTNVPGPRLFDISVGSATKVLGTNHVTGFAWHIDPVSLNFVQANIQNSFLQVAIAADGTAWATVAQLQGNPYNLYRALNFNGNYSTGWTQIAGALTKISCRNSAYAIGTVGDGFSSANIYQHNGTAFSLLPGNGALAQVSVGNDGTLYGVYNTNGNNVYRHNGATWVALPVSLDQISVGDDDRIVGRSSGNIYWFDNSNNSLNSIPKPNNQNVIDIEVATDGTIYALTDEVTNNVYRTTWSAVTGGGCPQLTTGPNGPTISGPGTVCAGAQATFTAAADANATFYTWTLGNGWTGTSTTNSITVTVPNISGGQLACSVTANNDCYTSATASWSPVVVTEPAPFTISGASTVCVGSGSAIQVTATGETISWTFPPNWVQTSTYPNNNGGVFTAGESGDITFTKTNVCFTRTETREVTVLQGPPAAPVFVSGNATLCKGVPELFEISVDAATTSSTFNFPIGTPWTAVIQDATSVLVTASGSQGSWLGPYTLTATAQNVCGSTSATLELTANGYTPDMGNYFEVNVNGDLQASYYSWVSYQWYLDGNLIPGATDQIYTPLVSGNYALETSLNGGFDCPGYLGASQYIEVSVTGVNEAATSSLNIYPNPFANEFVIEAAAATQISIMNAMGEVVLSRTINGRTSIDASSFSAGIYFIREETSGAVMKLVKN
jgi:hypothetical protein